MCAPPILFERITLTFGYGNERKMGDFSSAHSVDSYGMLDQL